MIPPHSIFILLLVSSWLVTVNAAVTVYHPKSASVTSSANGAAQTTAAAYNTTTLQPPPVPSPAPPTQWAIQLSSGSGLQNLSIQQNGAFFGFSIEFSVINQILGKNSSLIQVPFLNLLSNLVHRAGSVRIRAGGNTQETATLVDHLPDGKTISKDTSQTSNPTQTPPLQFTADAIQMMAIVSKMVGNVGWYLGIPFNDTTNWRLAIASTGQQILGTNLLGLQAGNEPDLYVRHGKRPQTYGPNDYVGEFGSLVANLNNDPAQMKNRNLLIGPNIATGDWTPEMIWSTNFQNTYNANLAALAVEHYPYDNCFNQFGTGIPHNAQDLFPTYLNHTSGISIVGPYLNSANVAQQAGKPLIMFETNSASCGGFAGLSDSFGAALWGLDYALTMAYSNFSGALFHVGGQNVFYNPFTPPPTNESATHQWTIGPIYYASLVMAEVLGTSNKAQVLDLAANGGNIFTPAYAIYENGNPMRVALFNYISDPSGANDYQVNISIGGGQTGQANGTPAQVTVKYLSAPSVSTVGGFKWAGQTFGGVFESDGRPSGQEDIQTVTCNPSSNTCTIKVPAPGFALVFLNDQAFSESGGQGAATTFTTTATASSGTISVDPSLLATSNGHKSFGKLGSTSKAANGARIGASVGGATCLLGVVVGFLVVFLQRRVGAL